MLNPLSLILFLLTLTIHAEAAVVKMEAFFGGTSAGDIFIEMFDTPSGNRSAAPITVANFLNYIDDGNGNRRYDGSFFHRSVSNFVIQGGGFKYDPNLGAFSLITAPHIPADTTIVNEFDATRSNLRGTVAMAKLGSDPDSATSEWFFNLVDNSANLDNQNGGFTVFGQVLGSGMSIVDNIAALPITNQAGAFNSLPVIDFTQGGLVTSANLITINSIISPYPLPLFIDPAPLDFGLISTSLVPITQNLVTIVNTGTNTVSLGTIGNQNPLSTPFALVTGADNCSNQSLTSFASCTFAISFDPQTAGTLLQDSLDISYDDGSASSLTLDISGTGSSTFPKLILPADSNIDFGDTRSDLVKTSQISLSNQGEADLIFTGFNITGTDANQFSITNSNCQQLIKNANCQETITFSPSGLGQRSATLEILTNDPDMPIANLTLTATSSIDNDGIPDVIEAAGPNGGDGNQDGIADDQQENVASFPDINGTYVSLESTTGTRLVNVIAINNPAPNVSPPAIENGSIAFSQGFYSYTLENVPIGGTATITFYLPAGTTVNSYFKFGRIPNDNLPFPHWYLFNFESKTQTGAEFLDDRVVLHLIDGGRGDNDLIADGIIIDPGGPALITSNSNSSGGGGCTFIEPNNKNSNQIRIDWWLLMLFVLLLGYLPGIYKKSCNPYSGACKLFRHY